MATKEASEHVLLEESAVEEQGIDGDELFEGLESVSD